jgi:hypothetical protein
LSSALSNDREGNSQLKSDRFSPGKFDSESDSEGEQKVLNESLPGNIKNQAALNYVFD